jgi:hypothetical protein
MFYKHSKAIWRVELGLLDKIKSNIMALDVILIIKILLGSTK